MSATLTVHSGGIATSNHIADFDNMVASAKDAGYKGRHANGKTIWTGKRTDAKGRKHRVTIRRDNDDSGTI